MPCLKSHVSPSSREDRVVLFDLDGVLLRGDTMAALVVKRLKEKPLRLLAALPLVLASRLLPHEADARAGLNRALVRLALRGLDEAGYRAEASAAAERLVASGRVNATAREAALRAAASSRVVVVTASEHYLARAFLDEAGLGAVDLLASTLRFTERGALLGTHNVGAMKVETLRRAAIPLDEATFYTDSASDLPLIQAVREPVLVNPDARTRRAVRRAHGEVRIVSW